MKWYVFHIYMIGSYFPSRESAWEESLRVYMEGSEEEAMARAKKNALADEVCYRTADDFELSWKVQSVRLVKELMIDSLDGQEIFSRSLVDSEARSLLSKIE
jgi:hypothetical protein